MSLGLSIIARNIVGNSIVSLIDIGSLQPNGYVELRSGIRPLSPAVTASGALLALCSFSKPAYNAFANGVGIANIISSDTNIAANGTATWFRIYNRDNIAVIDGDVGLTGSNSDMEFDIINFVKGGTVIINGLKITVPL